MEEKEETICVLASYGVSGYDIEEYRPNEYDGKASYRFFSTMSRMFSRKADAILDYDLSGRKAPLYDNTGNKAEWYYFPDEIMKMKRLR